MVHESHGSFHLAQIVGYQACICQNISVAQSDAVVVSTKVEKVRDAILNDVSLRWGRCAHTFARGTSFNPDGRRPYFWLLYWLQESNDWSIDVQQMTDRYPDHKHSIAAITSPKNRYLEKLLTDPRNELDLFLHYDPISHILSLEDPKAFYYLKHLNFRKFAADCGFSRNVFPKKYDFALSFAGIDRPLAQKLYDRLTASQLNVFYDSNEEQRLLGENVEEYLRPIYASEAEYIIPLLSSSYPDRIWTKFESDVFKMRFGEKRIIPVVIGGYRPSMFDTVYGIGYFEIKPDADVDREIERLANLLIARLETGPQGGSSSIPNSSS